MKGRVLITERIHGILQQRLENAGFECRHLEFTNYEEVKSLIVEYDGLVVRSKIKVDKELIDCAKRLKFIARAGSGMELIDIAYAQKKDIVCLSAPEGNRDSVAEQTICMLLSLHHNVGKAERALRKKDWQRIANRGNEMMGKTIGLLGYGNTGSAVAKRLQGFSVSVIAYDKYKKGFGSEYVEEVSLHELYRRSDVLSIHIPQNKETFGMVNKGFVDNFSKPIYLINTSRGGILKTEEIADALEAKKLLGLALDVFENENLDSYNEKEWSWFNRLIERDDVILTPHIAGVTWESFYKIGFVLSEKILALAL